MALAGGSPVPVPIPGAGVSQEVAVVIIERNNVTSPEAKFLIKVMGENRICVAHDNSGVHQLLINTNARLWKSNLQLGWNLCIYFYFD